MNGGTPTLNEPSRSAPASESLLGCALNLSEGRSAPVIEAIVSAARGRTAVLDVTPDPDHHRTVVTLGGPPDSLVEAVVSLATEAVTRIDVRTQRGVHPRLGAVDVIPFYPVFGTPMALAVAAADRCARTICKQLRVPCFFYEQSSRPAGRTLPWIRRHAFVSQTPDCGPGHPHPSAGACVVGARGLLVAYNVNLAAPDVGTARWIAAQLRDGSSALHGVRTLGLALASRKLTQVSVNIVDPYNTTLSDVFDSISVLAAKAGVQVLDSELIGLVPRACVSEASPGSVRLTKPPHILEEAFDRLR
ncbi:MAG: glutamate formiminotransferase [Actinobacteria bacterium]|nr:glutamate formiminotransferase [Actinomycetota bacterium]